jgi:hypothetical protein
MPGQIAGADEHSQGGDWKGQLGPLAVRPNVTAITRSGGRDAASVSFLDAIQKLCKWVVRIRGRFFLARDMHGLPVKREAPVLRLEHTNTQSQQRCAGSTESKQIQIPAIDKCRQRVPTTIQQECSQHQRTSRNVSISFRRLFVWSSSSSSSDSSSSSSSSATASSSASCSWTCLISAWLMPCLARWLDWLLRWTTSQLTLRRSQSTTGQASKRRAHEVQASKAEGDRQPEGRTRALQI